MDRSSEWCHGPARREFLRKTLCGGSALCLGCTALAARAGQPGQAAQPAHKFLADSGMTFKDVYSFAFAGYIETMKAMAGEVGRERLVELLKKSASQVAATMGAKNAPPPPNNGPLAMLLPLEQSRLFQHVLTVTIVEKSEKAVEGRVTECLWAQTFRAADAADIGYASICYPDFATARAFNPKMTLVRTKTLMQGDDCCNHRWVLEA